jgi:nicotinate phosphoribosyltransferase
MLNFAYCSDKYQYTMGKSFFDSGMKDKRAVFNLFYRKAPENNNWAVVSGTDEVVEMVENLGKMDPTFFEKFLPGDEYAEYRNYLSSMKFTGTIYAMREGEIAFPNEPIIIVEGPLIEAQVLETPMLCIMNHQMAVATKASRVCRATNRPVSEFGSRRAHGPWAATYGAKAAVIAGCASTSNILAGTMFDYGSTGTMAHSYVTSFGSSVKGEYTAFDTYIKTHKNEPLIMLIDTYDTLRCGILNAIKAFRDNGINDSYEAGYGIRLDSGDLAYLSAECRRILDEHDMTGCRIFATNSLDEYLITDLERQGACIDCYGVGDAIATSKAAPCFGNVYKLVEIDGEAVLKRSEDKIKLINPGRQITYRIMIDDPAKGEIYKVDVTCLKGDSLSRKIEAGEGFTVCNEQDRYLTKTFEAGQYKAFIMQQKVIEDGVRCDTRYTLQQKKEYYNTVLNHFSPSERRLINPHYYKVDISDDLYNLKMGIIEKLVKEIKAFKEI